MLFHYRRKRRENFSRRSQTTALAWSAVVCVFLLVDNFPSNNFLPAVRAFQTTRTKPYSDRKTLAILEHHRHERLLRDDNCNRKPRYCTELAASMDTTKSTVEETTTTMRSYQYDGWNLTYRTNSQNEKSSSTSSNTDVHKVLLIHPVGVGIASWFWEPLMESLNNDSGETKIKAYAPNLIGCGLSEGSDAWDPNKRGMFVPLSWVKGCEALMRQLDDDDYDKQLQNDDGDGEPKSRQQPWTVVTQGGLAPIGVLLASRNPTLINKLVLTSPPTWNDMVTAVPEANLQRNYLFFTGPIVSDLAFAILETRFLIRFFSDQFLFDQSCDETWLDKTIEEMCVAARPPVAAFNAGFCLQRSLEPELTSLLQNVWVVQGQGDKRDREGYSQNIPSCETITLPGAANVLPWEIPEATADLLKKIVCERS